MPDDGPSTRSLEDDPLVAARVTRVRRIAVGNGVGTAAEVRAVRAGRTDHQVRLRLVAKLGWRWSDDATAGRLDPGGGSRAVADDAAARAALERECRAAVVDPAESARVFAALRANPVEALEAFEAGGCCEYPLPTRFHCHETCADCAGEGGLECGCSDGRVNCPCCGAGGRVFCVPCAGRGYSEHVYVGYGGHTSASRIVCGWCCGTGWAPCGACGGDGREYCRGCGGSAWCECGPCAGTGWFTRAYRAWLTATAELSRSFPSAVPEGFRSAVAGIPVAELARDHAIGAALRAATRAPAGALVELSCRVPWIRAEGACGGHRVLLEAVGAHGHARAAVPPFLDGLLGPDHAGRPGEERSAAEVVGAARRSRLGRRIVAEVWAGGTTPDEAISEEFEGAASARFVAAWRERLGQAHREIAGPAAARAWRWLGPGAVAAAAAGFALDLPGLAVGLLGLAEGGAGGVAAQAALHTALAAVPVGVAWAAAAVAGLAAAGSAADTASARLPRQGPRPLLWLAACAAACALAGAAR
jgi:hypothetical protein